MSFPKGLLFPAPSSFHVFCGNRIQPKEETAVENLARYIIRASFSQERMKYLDTEGTVLYTAKDGNDRKVFDAEEWLAAMCSHVPTWGEQMVRYYGWYSNVLRGKRRKESKQDVIPCIIEADRAPAACRKSWARLIQEIGACPREGGEGRSAHLSEMPGNNEDHQFHRGSGGHQDHTQASRSLAHPLKASGKGTGCATIT
ncbi:MAG: transposase [Deltaproteobacteria bacterium]|nr:transposase [Deltaproteobacteria bacterium]